MNLKINLSSVSSAIGKLVEQQQEAISASQLASRGNLLNSFSSVSGLDQLGSSHSAVITSGVGSSQVVLASYAEQIEWLRAALNASVDALSGQDELFARGMDIADTGGRVAEESVLFPQRPTPRFEPFVFNPPVVRPVGSIDRLSSQFSGTNSGAVLEAQGSWNSMASAISDVSASLTSIARQLQEENSGETFEQAAKNIAEVANAGATFAANARVMAASVGTLNRIYTGHRLQVMMAAASIRAIVDPIERAAAEQAFLASFHATFQTDVMSGMPPLNNLMQITNADGSADEIALGMDEISGSGQSWSAAGLTPAGLQSIGQAVGAASQVGAGSFGTVAENVEGLEIGDALTSAASTGGFGSTSTLPAATSVNAGLGGGGSTAGSALNSMSAIPGAGMVGSGTGKHSLGNSTSLGKMNPAGSALKSESGMGARTQSASALGSAMTPMMGGAGLGGSTGTAGKSRLQSKQTSPVVGSSAHGSNALNAPGTGGVKASQSMGRSMMPMMPMGAPAGGQKNTGKVKSVTSAVEEDRNIAALLGDRGPVIPGVIGDWVRG
ncbi:hypothetical protein [Corynebacterium callunae]|uniref:PPE family protein n=1 Tax=Corynebacterium callunae DSM 20147 TaxID=1121353 RepID=M1TT32_9CORY|nr:hypothetical protein [Corynebacterium callunae]AGG67381.1 hypothetical protein H924_09715 [Corynebacterium callunae DSM 20147]